MSFLKWNSRIPEGKNVSSNSLEKIFNVISWIYWIFTKKSGYGLKIFVLQFHFQPRLSLKFPSAMIFFAANCYQISVLLNFVDFSAAFFLFLPYSLHIFPFRFPCRLSTALWFPLFICLPVDFCPRANGKAFKYCNKKSCLSSQRVFFFELVCVCVLCMFLEKLSHQ